MRPDPKTYPRIKVHRSKSAERAEASLSRAKAPPPPLEPWVEIPKVSLPILDLKGALVEMINTHTVSVVTGATGCGKTTQVPQYLLDNDPHAQIVVAQPRRIAAVGGAERVAAEVLEATGI